MDERISTANAHRWNMGNRWMKNKYWMLAVHIFCTVNSHEVGILFGYPPKVTCVTVPYRGRIQTSTNVYTNTKKRNTGVQQVYKAQDYNNKKGKKNVIK